MKTLRYFPLGLLASSITVAVTATVISLPDFESQGPYVDTIRFLRLTLKDDRFWNRGDVYKINVRPDAPRTRLHYKVWMQKYPTPLVIILPGLGGNYANLAPSVLAEAVYRANMSALLISSTFNWEFVLNGSSSGVPGYTPADAQDVYRALQIILHDVTNRYRRAQPTQLMLMGFSLGALNALYIADIDQRERALNLSRILAINPPVNLVYALQQLDAFYSIWTNWTPKELELRKNKAVAIYNALFDRYAPKPTNGFLFTIDVDEAKFAIGYTFRRALSETIKSIHARTNWGILSTPFRSSKTRFLDKEIERYGYYDYVMTFVRKAYPTEWETLRELNEKASLWRIQPTLATDPRILVLHTRNDFLLSDYDRDWLATVLGNRILFFEEGGHLGNLYRQEVLDVIANWLAGEPIPALSVAATPTQTITPALIVPAEPVTSAFPRVEPVVSDAVEQVQVPASAPPSTTEGLIPVGGIVPMDSASVPPPHTTPTVAPPVRAETLAPTNVPAASQQEASPRTITPTPPAPVTAPPPSSPIRSYEEEADRTIGGPREDLMIEYYEEEED